jgi:Bacterial nucleoid DNA-binding protein
MSLTKSDLANRIHEKTGISIAESLRHVSAFFESVKSAVHDEGQVKFSGFGNFVVKDKKEERAGIPRPAKLCI